MQMRIMRAQQAKHEPRWIVVNPLRRPLSPRRHFPVPINQSELRTKKEKPRKLKKKNPNYLLLSHCFRQCRRRWTQCSREDDPSHFCFERATDTLPHNYRVESISEKCFQTCIFFFLFAHATRWPVISSLDVSDFHTQPGNTDELTY